MGFLDRETAVALPAGGEKAPSFISMISSLSPLFYRLRDRSVADPIFFSDFNKFNGHSKIITKTINTQ